MLFVNKTMSAHLVVVAPAHARTNKLDVALADLKEVLRLSPDDATVLRFQARIRQLLATKFKKSVSSPGAQATEKTTDDDDTKKEEE